MSASFVVIYATYVHFLYRALERTLFVAVRYILLSAPAQRIALPSNNDVTPRSFSWALHCLATAGRCVHAGGPFT